MSEEAVAILDSIQPQPVPTDAGQTDGTLVIELEGTVQGIAVNSPKRNIGHLNYYDYDPAEYPNGILFRPVKRDGKPTKVTVIPPHYGSTLLVHSGKVTLDEGFEFHATAVSSTLAWTSGFGGPDVFLGAVGCDWIVDEPGAKWGLMLHNTLDVFFGCRVWSEHTGEHARYGHGYAAQGAPYWSQCVIYSAGAECWKQANRPEELCRWYPDQVAQIDQCDFGGWMAGGNMGGGIVLQGTGAHARISNCRLKGPSAVPTNAIMVDDGYGDRPHHESRFFDAITGAPQPKFYPHPSSVANGYIFIEDTAVDGWGRWFVPMVRVGSLASSTATWKTARGFYLNRSGVYGPSTKVEISHVQRLANGAPAVAVVGCNTPEIQEWMRSNGFRHEEETVLAYGEQGIWNRVSDGYVPIGRP